MKPPMAGPIAEARAPRECRRSHVAAHQPFVGEVGHERRLDGSMQALADAEHRGQDA